MGLVVPRRSRVSLDTDAVAALVRDSAARDFVCDQRRNGAHIVVCSTVLFQIGACGPAERRRRAKAILEHCTGYTRLRGPDIVASELENMAHGRRLTDIPLRPLREVEAMFFGPQPPDQVPFWAVRQPPRNSLSEALHEFDKLYKGHRKRVGDFERFVPTYLVAVVKQIVEANRREVGSIALPADLASIKLLAPHSALLNVAILMIANLYRGASRNYTKGAGSFSDAMLMAECAYSEVLATRDKELVLCWQMVRRAITDIYPMVIELPKAA